MHIGFEAKRAFHNFRGLGNYARTLIEGMLRFAPKHHFTALTPAPCDNRTEEWGKKMQAQFPEFQIATQSGQGLYSLSGELWRRFGLEREINLRSIDVIHGLSHELPVLAKNSACARIVTIHDLIFKRYPEFFPWFDRKVYDMKVRHACEIADIVVAICQQTADDLKNFLHIPENKIRVVYQAVSPVFELQKDSFLQTESLAKWGIPQKEFILMVGAFEDRKNHENLFRAIAGIKDCPPLVLVGRGERKEKILRALSQSLGIADRVHFLTDVPFGLLPTLYHQALFTVYPSFFEGFGLPLVESLFMQKAVITSQGSCFPEAAGPGAIYIDPLQVDSITEAIIRLTGDDKLRNQLAREGFEYVSKRFRLETTTARMLDVYESAVTFR